MAAGRYSVHLANTDVTNDVIMLSDSTVIKQWTSSTYVAVHINFATANNVGRGYMAGSV